MIASVVLSNLAYVAGALILAAICATIVVLRHRKPKSVEAHISSFNRGLQALAPESTPNYIRKVSRPAALAPEEVKGDDGDDSGRSAEDSSADEDREAKVRSLPSIGDAEGGGEVPTEAPTREAEAG